MTVRAARRSVIAGMAIALGFATMTGWGPASSSATATERAATVLTVDGKITGSNPAHFDLALLRTLPATTVKTMTPWTDGENTFVGVKLSALLAQLGGKGETVIADAVDDYAAAIPMEDIGDYDVIVAYAMNGQPLPANDKGPLWIIYPFSAYTTLQKDIYFARSVWQLNRLTVQ